MSEEENKAIKDLKHSVNNWDYDKTTLYEITILLNLIDKQQKEIEKLKKPKFIMNAETGEITKIHNDFISKDKIRDKIERISLNYFKANYTINEVIEILHELLGE